MKLITLNIWGGHVRHPLLSFIKDHQDTDIFCFQEVYHQAKCKISTEDREVSLNILADIQGLLTDHQAFFRPTVQDVYGIATFVRKNAVEVLDEGELSIHVNQEYSGAGPTHSRNMQWLKCRAGQELFSILNVHGLWNGMGKTDTPARLAQSLRIRSFMETIEIPKIICGDFNLRPDTESLKMIEKDLQNWVKIHKVNSTRTGLYTKHEKFADYILTSPNIAVHEFAVLNDEVSDHAPLLLDFYV